METKENQATPDIAYAPDDKAPIMSHIGTKNTKDFRAVGTYKNNVDSAPLDDLEQNISRDKSNEVLQRKNEDNNSSKHLINILFFILFIDVFLFAENFLEYQKIKILAILIKIILQNYLNISSIYLIFKRFFFPV